MAAKNVSSKMPQLLYEGLCLEAVMQPGASVKRTEGEGTGLLCHRLMALLMHSAASVHPNNVQSTEIGSGWLS